MTTELRFLPHKPANLEAPTAAELQSAFLVLDGVFLDVTAAFNEANKAAIEAGEAAQRLATNYETSFSITREYPITRREHRQVSKHLARLFRRRALIHNGRKPRV